MHSPGGVSARMGPKTAEGFPTPARFWARTRKTYDVAACSPVTWIHNNSHEELLSFPFQMHRLLSAPHFHERGLVGLLVGGHPAFLPIWRLLEVQIVAVDGRAAIEWRRLPQNHHGGVPHLQNVKTNGGILEKETTGGRFKDTLHRYSPPFS